MIRFNHPCRLYKRQADERVSPVFLMMEGSQLNSSDMHTGDNNLKLRKKIILPLALLVLLLLLVVYQVFYQERLNDWESDRVRQSILLERQFHNQLQEQINLLSTAEEAMIHNADLMQPFLQRDRELLYQRALPIYEKLNLSQQITHFYFTDINRVNFLRVHQAGRHGDTINRPSTLKAVRSGSTAWGLEIGPLGTYTLRVVRPIFNEGGHGERIGYLELGMEIEHLVETISQNVGMDFVLLLEKDAVERSVWESGMRRLGRNASWEQFDQHVVVYGTTEEAIQELKRLFGEDHANEIRLEKIGHLLDQQQGEIFNFIFIAINSSAAGHQGALVAIQDVTEIGKRIDQRMAATLVVGCLLLVAFILFLFLFLGRLERWIVQQQREANRALEEREARFRTITESTNEGIVSIDPNGEVIFWSQGAEGIFGYSKDEMIGQSINRIIPEHHRESHVAGLARVRDGGESRVIGRSIDVEGLHKDGRELSISLSISSWQSGDHRYFLGVISNITERKQREALLEAAKESLEAASRAKDEFLATMSHELRTPLTSIIGNSQLLAESALDEDQRQLLHTVEISSQSLLSLVNDILDLSKMESGKFQIDHAPFDLSVLLDEVCNMFEVTARDAGIRFTIDQQFKPEYQMWGDGKRVGQILINLLSNALKFTEEGSVVLTVSRDDEKLSFAVEDTGIGMTLDVLERLFRPFVQADSSISRRYGGTGLGLHVSLSLAQAMGGNITVTSEESVGSRFLFTLPYKESELPLKENGQVERASSASVLYEQFSGKVLVVEDTFELQMLESRILQSMGVDVTLAGNGEEAIACASDETFDLILMDMQMPVMDGVEATRQLRARGNRVPIVALTANVMQKHYRMFEEAGADGLLEKPINKVDLQHVLRRYLREGLQGPTTEAVDDSLKAGSRGRGYPSEGPIPLLVVDDEMSVLELYQTVLEDGMDSAVDQKLDEFLESSEPDNRPSTGGEFTLVLAQQGSDGVELARTALQQGAPFPVAFIDMRMPPGIDGLETARRLRQLDERIYIVFVTAFMDIDPETIDLELNYGTLYLNKPFDRKEVRQIARMLARNWQRDRALEEQIVPGSGQSATDGEHIRDAQKPTLDESLKKHFGTTILLAEDMPEIQALVRRILERIGFTVLMANNGKEAVEIATHQQTDLILMDIQMPVMDGIEATEALRNMGYTTPIVALSANVLERYRDTFTKAGGDEFLSKPVDKKMLVELIDQLIPHPGRLQEAVEPEDEVDGELLGIFLESAAHSKEELLKALAEENWERVKEVAHSIKGSGTSFGFPQLTEMARQVCDTYDTKQLERLPELTGELIGGLSGVLS